MNDKDDLRERALLHLDKLNPLPEDGEAAAAFFHGLVCAENAVVALYWPMKNELDVRCLIDDLLRRNIIVALPIAGRRGEEMAFARWDGKTDLIKSAFGILIPPEQELVEPDIVVVPMLAFDLKGHRLGRGAGHYDATLAALRARKEIIAVGMAHAEQAVLFSLPAEPHDQKLDLIITPKGVHDFRQ